MKKILFIVLLIAAPVVGATVYTYSGSVDASASIAGCSACNSGQTSYSTSSNLAYGSSQSVSGVLSVTATINGDINWDNGSWCSDDSSCYGEGSLIYYYSTNSGSTWNALYEFDYSCTGGDTSCQGYQYPNTSAGIDIPSGTVTNLNTLLFKCYSYTTSTPDPDSGDVPDVEAYCTMGPVTVTASGKKYVYVQQQ